MTEEQQLKLQAFLDGELPEPEARAVAARVAGDSEAADLLAELRHTRKALAGHEPELKLPESREFYWSKIEREIRRLETETPPPPVTSGFAWLRRALVTAGATAAVVILATFAVVQSNLWRPGRAAETELALADSGTFTYHDYANGMTLVWFDYPAER
jgi:anti-sigma factor RsiW